MKYLRWGRGARGAAQNTSFFQKVKINFENQIFSDLFDIDVDVAIYIYLIYILVHICYQIYKFRMYFISTT